MNDYISKLNSSEIEILCQIISGKEFKELFKKNSKGFSRLRPGFRTQSLTHEQALALASKNMKENFISTFINFKFEEYLDVIAKAVEQDSRVEGDADKVLAVVLSHSKFAGQEELYFKLVDREVDEAYLTQMRKYQSEEKEPAEQKTENQEQNVQKQIKELTAQLIESQQANFSLREQHEKEKKEGIQQREELRVQVNQLTEKVQELEREKRETAVELTDLRARAEYEDVVKENIFVSDGYTYISLCEVDSGGGAHLNRLADINRKGMLETFILNEALPWYYDNRNRLYATDGPIEDGTVAVWNWKSVPSDKDPDKDIVKSVFNKQVTPIEVLIVSGCPTEESLIERIKTGVAVSPTTKRILIAAYCEKGQLIGFACQSSDLEQEGNNVKLKSSVFVLPRYRFGSQDIAWLSNKKAYYRSIQLGMPEAIVHVKDPLSVVKELVFSRHSWQTFKEKGRTRAEWKNFRDLFESLDTVSIIDEIEKRLNCAHVDAQRYFEEFTSQVVSYMEGGTFEDKTLEAVIFCNEELMNRCKALVLQDWEAENKKKIQQAETELQNIQREISLSAAQHEKDNCAAKEQLDKIQAEHDELQRSLNTIQDSIAEKELLAEEVEAAVKERIEKARANAADFIASMAFIMPNTCMPAADERTPATVVVENQNSFGGSYTTGVDLAKENLEKYHKWTDLIDVLAGELGDAGVQSKYTCPLAAFLYAAYLNHTPILVVGPNGAEITDAVSATLFGRTAGVLECTDSYNKKALTDCDVCGDEIVRIEQPFTADWISHIPAMIGKGGSYFYLVHPYSEDVQIEPKSLYNYLLPLFTELFVDKTPSRQLLGGEMADDFQHFQLQANCPRNHTKLLSSLHATMIVKNQIHTVLQNMHTMIKAQTADYDVLFGLLPYAYATNQLPVLMEALKNPTQSKLMVSGELLAEIEKLYGDCE